MSFGVGIGDIIAVSKLATKVFQGLNGAPEEYKKFASQVFSIKSILELLNETTSRTPLPLSDNETLAHLVRGCHDILQDLEKVIDKYEGTSMRRFSRTMEFVSASLTDNTELQQNLNTQLTLLANFQMGLASRGQARIERALISISKQIQLGQRTNSVLEGTVLEEEDIEEIWTRIEDELEEEGVERVAISENKVFIYNWVEKAFAAGDLDEKPPATELQPVWGLRTRSPSPNAEVTTRERLEALNLRLKSPDRVDSATIMSPVEERVIPQSSVIVPVRPPSARSHRSQIDTWRRTNGPDEDYVHRMLLRLVVLDAKLSNDSQSRELLMRRAFHQMNWKEEEGLLRHVVVAAWKSVTDRETPSITKVRLVDIARSEDRNRDGVIDLVEFLQISEKVVNAAEKVHDQGTQNMIEQARIEAIRYEKMELKGSRNANLSEVVLPWGWVFSAPNSFRETISGYKSASVPRVGHYSLSCMAYFSAPRALSRIHQIVDDYRMLCAADSLTPDSTITEALATIRNAALKFTHLENPSESEIWYSDISKLWWEGMILSAVDPKNPAIDGFPSEAKRIRIVTAAYRTLIDHILGFLYTMKVAYQEHRGHSYASDTVSKVRALYKTTWSAKRMEARARLVSLQLATWHEVENDLQLCREWRSKRPQIGELAIQTAKSQNAIAKSELRERMENREKIEKTLFPTEPVIFMRVVSASIVVKSKWPKRGKLPPSPFAEIKSDKSGGELHRTGVAQKTTNPIWDQQFIPIPFRIGLGEGIEILVLDDDKDTKYKPKDIIGRATVHILNSRTTSYDQGYKGKSDRPSHLTLKDRSLFESFSGFMDLKMRAGQITVEVKWKGLVSQVRDLNVPVEDYIESLPDEKRKLCAELFSDELKSIAYERMLTKEKSEEAKTEDDFVLELPPDWRLRRDVPESFYLSGADDAKPFNPNGPLPRHIEMRVNSDSRKYYFNHDTRESSFEPSGGDLGWKF